MPISNHIRDQSWTKVTSQIDRISSFPTETRTDSKDDEKESEWCKIASAKVAIVLEGVDQEHQEGAGDEFGEELARLCHERRRICAEDAGSGCVASDCANIGTALKDVNGGLVVCVDDR